MKVNKKILSDVTGFSERAITDFQKEGMPVQKKGKRGTANEYDTKECIKWLIDRQNKKNMSELDAEKVRLTKCKADIAEMELQELNDRLVDSELITKAWVEVATFVRSRIKNIAGKMSLQLSQEDNPGVIKKILDDEIYDCLSEIGEKPPSINKILKKKK